jgi:hypothetical protein
LLPHRLEPILGHERESRQIDSDHPIVIVSVHILDPNIGRRWLDRRVIDQNVEAPKLGYRPIHDGLAISFECHIGFPKMNSWWQALGKFRIDVCTDNSGTRCCKPITDSSADPIAPTGN